MRDYITLGPVPCEEKCEQVGPNCDYSQMTKECRVYINQLKRQSPKAELRIKSFPHDFGTYKEVAVFYDDQNEESVQIAYDLEASLPENWDEEAIRELNLS